MKTATGSRRNLDFIEHLEKFSLDKRVNLFGDPLSTTVKDFVRIDGKSIPRFTNEYWTSRQRQGNALHEIAYRACFKAQLPRFFIEQLTEPGDIVYDCFAGRGTTIIEAALLGREVIANDINPLSRILCHPRIDMPEIGEIKQRLTEIP
ncbi:MAG: DNA methyltransferase, partial [Burkholderiales bacterium]